MRNIIITGWDDGSGKVITKLLSDKNNIIAISKTKENTTRISKENTQVNYVSTINDGKPSCSPFGDPIMVDNKIYVITNKHKNLSKQIEKNNNVCIVAYDDKKWIRINCELIDDSENMKVKQAVIDEFDWAIEADYTLDNPEFQVLYMANAESTIYDEEGEVIETYNF